MSGIPHEELPILEALINIRNRLTALKKDSSEFIRSNDVQQLYQQVIKQVSKLNAVRDELQANSPTSSMDASTSSSTDQAHHATHENDSPLTHTNRVDTTLNDVFALLSLFFLTIGRSRESPATFSQLGCMKQLLDHMAESGVYTEADLKPFASRLAELRDIIRKDSEQGRHPSQLTKLMMRKLDGCEKVLKKLEGTLKVLSVELVAYHQKIVSIRRQLAAAAAKPKPARAEIKALQEELRKIDSKRVDGKFLGPGGSSVPAGQAILVGLLEECFEICHDITAKNDEVPTTLQPIYDRLTEIHASLEHLVLTHRWTLRETDLWNYQVTLKEIDRLRVDGKFVDTEGKQPEGQLVLLYLLRRCYGLIYRLVASSEPISEELMPISNKLSTVSKCLKEVSKYGGPFTMRDLYPYRLALHQIDNMRSPVKDKDGNDTGVKKWLSRDGSVPEGQAILRAQFEEVEQTIEEMLNREDEDDDDDDDDQDGEWDGSTDSSVDQSETDSEALHSEASYERTLADASIPGPRPGPGAVLSDTGATPTAISGIGAALAAGQGQGQGQEGAPAVLPPPERSNSAASSAPTLRPGQSAPADPAHKPTSLSLSPSLSPSPNPSPSPSANHNPDSAPWASKPVTMPQPIRYVSSKVGRDFRDGVGELTGLSHRSPPVGGPAPDLIANATSGYLSSLSAISSSGSTPQSASLSVSPSGVVSGLRSIGTIRNENQLPVGMAPLAVLTPGRVEAQKEMGPTDGANVGALIGRFHSSTLDDGSGSNVP